MCPGNHDNTKKLTATKPSLLSALFAYDFDAIKMHGLHE